MVDKIERGLSFDDILLSPQKSAVLPEEVSTESKITSHLVLSKPIISSPMDKVTEAAMAISMAINGGLGVIHRNLTPEEQVKQVESVKRSENWVIRNPRTIGPQRSVREAKELMDAHGISGLPVIVNDKLKGIITRRDVRLQAEESTVRQAMTEEVVTADTDTDIEQAKAILEETKVEKLPLVDENSELAGLITMRDIEKKKAHPEATLDQQGHLKVAAAVGPQDFKRAQALKAAGVDLLVVDTAHGHSQNVLEGTEDIKDSLEVEIMAGNVATEAGARDLIEAGADSLRVGIGPGSICTTRIMSGVGVPQVTAIRQVYKGVRDHDKQVSLVADGGIRYSGDIVKALASGADAVMLGNLLAGTDAAPGRTIFKQGRKYKEYRGMGSVSALEKRDKNRYNQSKEERTEYVPEGVEGVVPYKGEVEEVLHQLLGGLTAGMGYLGAENIKQMRQAKAYRLSESGKRESHPHGMEITEESPNYSHKSRQ